MPLEPISRVKRFAHSLLSGYLLLAVNVLFTLAAVPLALHYLSPEEFGLWAVTSQIASYISLLDFGLSSSAARILIDYKDHKKKGEYGGVIQTDVLVGLSQALVIGIVGIALAFELGPLLLIPATLRPEFKWLILGQSGIAAMMFVTRIIAHILTANQRFDICNYSSALAFMINYAVMWRGFSRGGGVFSMLWGQAAGVVLTVALNWIGCYRLKLFPQRGEWGRPTWERFRELFAFGRDVSLYSLGSQFVNASQTMLLTRLVGLDAAAVWSVYTRAYLLLVQFIGKIFDFSASALAEMIVRDERQQLLKRFREIAVVSVNLAVAAGVLFAIGNSTFVQIWKAGKTFQIQWSRWNDVLLAVYLVFSISVRVHSGLVGQTKAFQLLKYIYFFEGLAFICFTILLHRFGGITMMLAVSIMCSLCFTFSYGLWRTQQYFRLSWSELARWHRGTVTLVATVAPVAIVVWWWTTDLQALQRLAADSLLVIWTALMFVRYGLGPSLKADACRLAPHWAKPVLARIGFANPKA